jgi:hypothetical protein
MSGKGWMQALGTAHSQQADWLSWLQARLPEELRAAAVNVIPKGRELVVMSRSAAWSTRLRYALAAVEPQIRERSPGIARLTVRVAPPPPASSP